jgi:sporulation protein YlmC with PRC-barrel domain
VFCNNSKVKRRRNWMSICANGSAIYPDSNNVNINSLKKEIVMKKNGFGLYVAVICILLAGQVFAETGTTPLEGWQRSSQITGMTVNNPQGEKLGTINDLLIDHSGAVKYAILSHGGLLGIGDKLIPIPWNAFKLGKEKSILVVNIDKGALEKAPNFDPKEWPKVTSPESLKKIDLYYK